MIVRNNFDPESESFFSESKKIAFLNEIVVIFSWRLHPLIAKYLQFYHQNLGSPYKQIRDALGKTICNLVNLHWRCSSRKISEIIHNPSTLIPAIDPSITQIVANISAELKALKCQNCLTKYHNVCKTGIFL